MGGLISALANFLAVSSVLRFIAFKAVMFALFTIVLPIIFWNFSLEWMTEILTYAIGKISNLNQSMIYDMTGLTGWIAVQLQLPGAVNNIVAALGTRFLITALLRV